MSEIHTEEEFQKAADVLLSGVPEKYREKCKKLAIDLGHSFGYGEVYYKLIEIVTTIFEEEYNNEKTG